MKRTLQLMIVMAAVAVAVALRPAWRALVHPAGAVPRTETVARGALEVWHAYEGIIESRQVHLVRSQLSGAATLTSLVPDGSMVEAGDVLARFDAAEWERDVRRLDRDATVAREDLRSLEHAKLPLDIAAIETRITEAERVSADEHHALADTQTLVDEDLVPDLDLHRQQARARQAATAVLSLRHELELTRTYLHPALLARARAQHEAAEQELSSARGQVSNCVVRAPCGGRVVHLPLPLGTDFRPARVGDSLYRNQPFLQIADAENLLLRCAVPEADLLKAHVGAEAIVTPLAHPALRLEGVVESIGAVSDTLVTRTAHGKNFGVTVSIADPPPTLRAGMSGQVRICAYAAADVLRVPRRAVFWEGETPHCVLWQDGTTVRRIIRVGEANESHFEVIEGLRAGDRVVAE